MKCRWALLLAGAVAIADAQTTNRFVGSSSADGAGDETPWQELEFEPPAFPKLDKLREFYVSAMATNKYFIDPATLTVGADGVVRYVLVVKTAGGATNVSYEGMLCKDRTWKHYAAGRSSSGTWTKAPAASSVWRPIENIPVNRHHAALSRDLFCPLGNPIGSADEGRNALRLGKHPNAN
jgi:hypothetical protein